LRGKPMTTLANEGGPPSIPESTMHSSPAETAQRQVRAYNLPGGIVRVYPNRSCRFFPNWCCGLESNADRGLVARALRDERAKGTHRLRLH